jgi:hypothetical protein
MDSLQGQITELDRKVDRLYTIVERLSYQLTELALETQHQSDKETKPFVTVDKILNTSSYGQERVHSLMEHKDVLIDDGDLDNRDRQKNDPSISTDIQIRRLTTQLTAAYNRIAVLEEQLLARRLQF